MTAPRPLPAAARGIGLLELMFVLALLSGLVFALSYKTGDVFAKRKALDTTAALTMADNQLRQYIAEHGRLPCPDGDGDGYSDVDAGGACLTGQKGYLPYKTLGMTDANYVNGEVPMLYGAYRQGSLDFTGSGQVYTPSYADTDNAATDVVITQRNTFDFCALLAQLRDAPYAAAGLQINTAPTPVNAVYALAVAGLGDRDGVTPLALGSGTINPQYDGVNASSAVAFAAPQSALSAGYDDRTLYRGAADLHNYYRCEAMNQSVNLLAESISFQEQTQDMADGNYEDVRAGLKANVVGSVLAAWALGQSIAEIAGANEVLAISSALLATVSATCPIPPWVTCALIPVYTIAVTNASIGLGLAIGAAVTSGVSLGLQITAAVMYGLLEDRTSAPPPPTAVTMAVSDAKLTELRNAYSSDKATAQSAYNATLALPATPTATLDTIQQGEASAVGAKIGAVGDATLSGVLGTRLNGQTLTCVPPADCTGYTARQVPTLDGDGKVVLNASNQPVTHTIYTREVVAGLIPAVQGYYQALAQAGSGDPINSTDPAAVAANAALAGAPVADPAAALATMQSRRDAYSSLLGATADFDSKNLSYAAANSAYSTADAAYVACGGAGCGTPAIITARTSAQTTLTNASGARSTALATLRTEMGDASWDYAGVTSLCGASGCGWMADTSAGGANPTGSALVNTYLGGYTDYQIALNAQKTRDKARDTASAAWSGRNTYKTALCANLTPSASFVGSATPGDNNPASWDAAENLLGTPVSGLACGSGGATPIDLSGQSADQAAAEKTKYCDTPATQDATLCALYSSPSATRSLIRGPRPIVDALIQKGITQ